jgi:hypothetical protein
MSSVRLGSYPHGGTGSGFGLLTGVVSVSEKPGAPGGVRGAEPMRTNVVTQTGTLLAPET